MPRWISAMIWEAAVSNPGAAAKTLTRALPGAGSTSSRPATLRCLISQLPAVALIPFPASSPNSQQIAGF